MTLNKTNMRYIIDLKNITDNWDWDDVRPIDNEEVFEDFEEGLVEEYEN